MGNGTKYTCEASKGCEIDDGTVSYGTIRVTGTSGRRVTDGDSGSAENGGDFMIESNGVFLHDE